MIFSELPLPGAYVIDMEMIEDKRGFFARTFCAEEFARHGLASRFVQCSISYNARKHTLRGMHYQVAPHAEAKLVQCVRGAIHDVIIDLRPDSPAFKCWTAIELSALNHRMLYIPEGFAHGFQTVEDDTDVFYQISDFYQPSCSRGVRWDDPVFAINWPKAAVRIISDKDRNYPDFTVK